MVDSGHGGNEERGSPFVHLALVHHANQYVIADGYVDRDGMGEILGLKSRDEPGSCPRGILPLLQMHLTYQVPLNLHLSGTLIESLAWHYPEAFSIIQRLHREGLIELIGSTFAQNIMPLFSAADNRRQIEEELWLYRRHLRWDLGEVKTFWVPERVWNTDRLAEVLASESLPNGGFRRVLLDDRLLFTASEEGYEGSARERFDGRKQLHPDAFSPWEIDGGHKLVLLPISKRLRYLIAPGTPWESDTLASVLRWVMATRRASAIAIYADDLERVAGVGGWERKHAERYEQFLRFLRRNAWIRPVLINRWAEAHPAVGARRIDPGAFYELAQSWRAGEDYRGWHHDPCCQQHRQHLDQAELCLSEAQRNGADPGLLEIGRRHLLHSCYETSWHDHHGPPSGTLPLAGWAAALASHARTCGVIAAAALWATRRDGAAHAELVDLDGDGESELVLKNQRLFAVFSPRWGGRLVFLFDLGGRSGILVVGNVSDDWNLQEELNKYMDAPRNHPGAFADVGHEHDRYEVQIDPGSGPVQEVVLRNVEPGSALHGTEKRLHLQADADHLCVTYRVPRPLSRLNIEACLSPDYARALRNGRNGLRPFDGRGWRGWQNGSRRVWLRADPRQSVFWDTPYQPESGHGHNLRLTTFSSHLHVDLGVGQPTATPCVTGQVALARARPAAAIGEEGASRSPSRQLVTDPHFMRRFLDRAVPSVRFHDLPVRSCSVTVLRPHHDRLTVEYRLAFHDRRSSPLSRSLVGTWRNDGRGGDLDRLLTALWNAGLDERDGLAVPRPVGYWRPLQLQLTWKARGTTLKQWVFCDQATWVRQLRRVATWLARLHASPVPVSRSVTREAELRQLTGWIEDVQGCDAEWITPHRGRVQELIQELARRHSTHAVVAPCLIHGDFHPENILVRDACLTVVDFEHAATADPAMDLGYLLGQLHIQADRYWRRRGRPSPLDLDRLGDAFCTQYARTRRACVPGRVPFYRAWTYIKHVVHTIRMNGTENPTDLAAWLEQAASCLAGSAPHPVAGAREGRATTHRHPAKTEEATMASERTLATQTAAREELGRRIDRATGGEFIRRNVHPHVPGSIDPESCRVSIVQNDGTGAATVRYAWDSESVFAKLYLDDSGVHSYRVLRALWEDGFGAAGRYRVSEPLDYLDDASLLLIRGAAGPTVAEAASEKDLAEGACEAARWLAQLHGSPLRVGDTNYPWGVYHKLMHRLAKASASHPGEVDSLLEMADRLEGLATGLKLHLVQSHGQFRHIHVFRSRDCVTVIDLDRSRPADPAKDLGEFIHRMRARHFKSSGGESRAELATDSFLETYAAVHPQHLASLPFYWGYHALVSLWRFMKGSTPQDPEWNLMTDYYLSEFETAAAFRRRS